MTEWEWYQDANTFRLFVHLIIRANHKDKKWEGHLVKRGQLITGRKALAKELKISEQSIRTAITHLVATKELTTQPTNRHTIITLVNYDSYQTKEKNQPAKQPTINQLLTTNKNVKNINILLRDVPEFEINWNEYYKHRTQMRKPLTEKAANMALNALSTFHLEGVDVISVMNSSIQNGWTGLFKPQKSKPKQQEDELDWFSTGWSRKDAEFN